MVGGKSWTSDEETLLKELYNKYVKTKGNLVWVFVSRGMTARNKTIRIYTPKSCKCHWDQMNSRGQTRTPLEKYTLADEHLLLDLRDVQKRSWTKIAESLSTGLVIRSPGTVQRRYHSLKLRSGEAQKSGTREWWTPDEILLLRSLRETEKMKWAQVVKVFARKRENDEAGLRFPAKRSLGSLKTKYGLIKGMQEPSQSGDEDLSFKDSAAELIQASRKEEAQSSPHPPHPPPPQSPSRLSGPSHLPNASIEDHHDDEYLDWIDWNQGAASTSIQRCPDKFHNSHGFYTGAELFFLAPKPLFAAPNKLPTPPKTLCLIKL